MRAHDAQARDMAGRGMVLVHFRERVADDFGGCVGVRVVVGGVDGDIAELGPG